MKSAPVRRPSAIELDGVRVHNLRGLDVRIPLGKFTVVTGVSGSGKSSLAFDTLHAEGQRRYIESFSAYARQFLPKFDRPALDRAENIPPAIAVAQHASVGGATSVAAASGLLDYLRPLFALLADTVCPNCDRPVPRESPEAVLRSLEGVPSKTAILVAFPFADQRGITDDVVAEIKEQGFLRLAIDDRIVRLGEEPIPSLGTECRARVVIDRLTHVPENEARLLEAFETAYAHGSGTLDLRIDDRWQRHSRQGICSGCGLEYPAPTAGMFIEGNPAALPYRLAGQDFSRLLALSADEVRPRFESISKSDARGQPLTRPILARLAYLHQVGLGYLTLDRKVDTLSTGEARRVALGTALGTGLARTMFILDEPTAGLHPSETETLVAAIRALTLEQNTVVVVEHDPAVILAADEVIDLGPGAGSEGGQRVYQGPPAGLAEVEESYTAGYLEPNPTEPRPYRAPRGFLHLEGARRNNLKSIDVKFPLGCLCVVVGVSGSGKSSLVLDTLYPALQRVRARQPLPEEDCDRLLGAERVDDVVLVDSQAIGRTARSNPATYVQIFDDIRALFADTLEARTRGLGGGDFSFNVAGGRCERCAGNGYLSIDMQFLPDVRMTCPECDGTRYQRRVLEVKYRGRNIAEVLDLTVRDAFGFFRGQIRVQERLKRLLDVGLDYLRLGQPCATLSGGEAQRLKLATYLGAKKNKRTLFFFEEPTTGLHPADIETLLDCFSALLDVGHSLLVIEHNLQVMQAADHILELGPGAGPAGGSLIAAGNPFELSQQNTPTGLALRRG